MKGYDALIIAVVALVIGLVLSAAAKGCTTYNVKQLELQQRAVEAGCSVVGYNIVCPQR